MSITQVYESEKAAKKEYEKAEKEEDELNKSEGLTVHISQLDNTVTAYYTFTLAEMDSSVKALYEDLFAQIKDKNIEDAKNILKSGGYTCN